MNAPMTIKRLNLESLDDFLGYFDHRAFLDDPNWDGCYCQFYLNTPQENESSNKESNRASACSRIETGAMDGYLAYENDKVVGWCAAGSSLMYPGLPGAEERVARILCFNVDPDLRGQGISGQMLDLILDDLQTRGFEAVEAGPNQDSYSNKSYRGSREMFRKRGFEQVTELGDGFVLVRKHLN
jgi:ribosomal protein S18 acetylase RimI-like enzyme